MIEYIGHTIFADSIFVEYMDDDNVYQRKDIPKYGDFENFITESGYLQQDIYEQEFNDIDTVTITYDQFIEHSLNKTHLIQYLNKQSHG